MTDERITEIEIKLAHAEQSLLELSDVIVRQQSQLEQLAARCEKLSQQLAEGEGAVTQAKDEKPPHY